MDKHLQLLLVCSQVKVMVPLVSSLDFCNQVVASFEAAGMVSRLLETTTLYKDFQSMGKPAKFQFRLYKGKKKQTIETSNMNDDDYLHCSQDIIKQLPRHRLLETYYLLTVSCISPEFIHEQKDTKRVRDAPNQWRIRCT